MIKKARRVFAAVVAVLLVCFTAAPVLSANEFMEFQEF